jgi:hypothetical protein
VTICKLRSTGSASPLACQASTGLGLGFRLAGKEPETMCNGAMVHIAACGEDRTRRGTAVAEQLAASSPRFKAGRFFDEHATVHASMRGSQEGKM